MTSVNKFSLASFAIWLVATIDATGGLLGLWSVVGDQRPVILLVEGGLLLVLLLTSLAIRRWVYQQTADRSCRTVAWLSVLSIVLCIAGDLVNFNLPQTLYRHDGIVRHDYLADSVWFFAPGYLLLLAAVTLTTHRKLKAGTPVLVYLAAALFGGISFASMHLENTGWYVSAITGSYAVFITVVGASGIVLILAFGGRHAPLGVWLVGAGLLLAAMADAVIGQFWLYGNAGEGFYPAARYVNWSLYIGSQCLVIHLPRIAVGRVSGTI